MTCPHQSQPPGKDTGRRICKIGLYGGRPFIGNCASCIAAGENNEGFAKALSDRSAKSHPANRAKIHGCCDRADNF
jgi:hypothetical protein